MIEALTNETYLPIQLLLSLNDAIHVRRRCLSHLHLWLLLCLSRLWRTPLTHYSEVIITSCSRIASGRRESEGAAGWLRGVPIELEIRSGS